MANTLTHDRRQDGARPSARTGPGLRLVEVAALSDAGRVRAHSEDRVLTGAGVLAVADGMGGHAAGEVAAQMAVDVVAGAGGRPTGTAVHRAAVRVNREIHRRSATDRRTRGMGTTLTAAVVDGEAVDVVHVGDSRAYLVRDVHVWRLTDDHTLVAELQRRGVLSPAEARTHPRRNIVTRALGADADVRVDHRRVALAEGDLLLVCSDGLSSELDDAELAAELRRDVPLAALAEALVARANAARGADNITVALGRVGR